MADGYEFVQPLYSSFTKSKVFEVPKLPPRPRPAAPERPAAKSGAARDAGRGQSHSAPSGHQRGGLEPGDMPLRPGTAAPLRPLSMASVLGHGSGDIGHGSGYTGHGSGDKPRAATAGRGVRTGVRSGGFQLVS